MVGHKKWNIKKGGQTNRRVGRKKLRHIFPSNKKKFYNVFFNGKFLIETNLKVHVPFTVFSHEVNTAF